MEWGARCDKNAVMHTFYDPSLRTLSRLRVRVSDEMGWGLNCCSSTPLAQPRLSQSEM